MPRSDELTAQRLCDVRVVAMFKVNLPEYTEVMLSREELLKLFDECSRMLYATRELAEPPMDQQISQQEPPQWSDPQVPPSSLRSLLHFIAGDLEIADLDKMAPPVKLTKQIRQKIDDLLVNSKSTTSPSSVIPSLYEKDPREPWQDHLRDEGDLKENLSGEKALDWLEKVDQPAKKEDEDVPF